MAPPAAPEADEPESAGPQGGAPNARAQGAGCLPRCGRRQPAAPEDGRARFDAAGRVRGGLGGAEPEAAGWLLDVRPLDPARRRRAAAPSREGGAGNLPRPASLLAVPGGWLPQGALPPCSGRYRPGPERDGDRA